MVLGRPQHVVAEAIHELCHVARGGEGLPQAFRGIAPVVGGRAGAADIVELDLADIEHMEVSDHRAISPASKVGTKAGIAPCKLERPSVPIPKFRIIVPQPRWRTSESKDTSNLLI